MKANQTIRETAKKKGIKHWRIAMYLGVSEQTFMRWLRIPLTSEREKAILEAIDDLAKGGYLMPDLLTVRGVVRRSKSDGMPVSEYTLRQWIRLGVIPTRKAGTRVLIFYPNVVSYLRCENGQDNTPATGVDV